MRVAAIIWCSMIPQLQVYILRRLSTDLYKNHMEGVNGFYSLMEPMVKKGQANIKEPGTVRFSNGSRIFLSHCQYEHNVRQFQGTDIHVLMIDELTHWTEDMYKFLRGRLRAPGIVVPKELTDAGIVFPRILCGSNPGDIGHNWVKMTFVDSTNYGKDLYQASPEEGGMLRGFLPARMEDNLTLMEEDPTYAARLSGLGSDELVQAMREGNWEIVAGGMFDDVWRRDKIVLEPFPLPHTWRLTRSFDWGSTKPFSVGWWAYTDDSEVEIAPGVYKTFAPGSWIRFAEWYGCKKGRANVGLKMNSTEIAEGILEREAEMQIKGKVRRGVADSSIFDSADGASTATKMALAGVKWEKADKSPGSRKQGWETMREMFTNAAQTPMENPGLFVFSTCKDFIRTIPTLPRDKNDMDDVDTNAEDHIGDDTRYRIWKKPAKIAQVRYYG